MRFWRGIAIISLCFNVCLYAVLLWHHQQQAEAYLVYVAYLDHRGTVMLRAVRADGQATPQDLTVPRQDWSLFNRFVVTDDQRYILFNVRNSFGTHTWLLDFTRQDAQRWAKLGTEEYFYALIPNSHQALVAVAGKNFRQFYLHSVRIGRDQGRLIAPSKVSLFGYPPHWWQDWFIFQHITDKGYGITALHMPTERIHELTNEFNIIYLYDVVDGWVYWAVPQQELLLFKTRIDGTENQLIGIINAMSSYLPQMAEGVLVYSPAQEQQEPVRIWVDDGQKAYPLLNSEQNESFLYSVDGWFIVETYASTLQKPSDLIRVRPNGADAQVLPASQCGDADRVGRGWSEDGRIYYSACYRDFRYWLEARQMPSGDFISQRYIDLPVQPTFIVGPSGDWVLLRVNNVVGGVDYYRADADGQALIQLTNDAAQKDFATWYELPDKSFSFTSLGVLLSINVILNYSLLSRAGRTFIAKIK